MEDKTDKDKMMVHCLVLFQQLPLVFAKYSVFSNLKQLSGPVCPVSTVQPRIWEASHKEAHRFSASPLKQCLLFTVISHASFKFYAH